MRLTIFSPGKKLSGGLDKLFNDYVKRLTRFNVKLEMICPPSNKPEQLLAVLKKQKDGGARIVILDERGHQFSSAQLAGYLEQVKQETPKISLVIGDPFGVAPEVLKLADVVLSLGPLTLPHQIVRVIVAEQIYRAFCINAGLPYHHE